MRALAKDAGTLAAVHEEIDLAKGLNPAFDAFLATTLPTSLAELAASQGGGRRAINALAVAL